MSNEETRTEGGAPQGNGKRVEKHGPGTCKRLARSTYDRIDAVNATLLKKLYVSAMFGRYLMENPPAEKKAWFIGKAQHVKVLEPAKFKREYVSTTLDRRSKEYKKFLEMNDGRKVLTEKEWGLIDGMSGSLHSHGLIAELLKAKGLVERTIIWRDRESGLLCKGQPDKIIADRCFVDLKTCASLARFESDFAKFGYDIQLGFYGNGLVELGFGMLPAKVIAVEKEPPHDRALFNVPEEILTHGMDKAREAMIRYQHGVRTGEWPGLHEDEEVELRLPPWALPEEETLAADFGEL